jgi:hypothetical protein
MYISILTVLGELPTVPTSLVPFQSTLVSEILSCVLNLAHQDLVPSSASSPYISEQLVATLTRLCATYLNLHDPKTLVAFLLQLCYVYLTRWPTQPLIVTKVIDLLLTFPSTNAATLALQDPLFHTLWTATVTATPGMH